jgi:phosphoserine phosphatase RsbU/P
MMDRMTIAQPETTGARDSAERVARAELLSKRVKLERALEADAPGPIEIGRLLRQVDDALARMEAGSWGLCEVCHDPIEADRLAANPLERFCLDDLSRTEREALEADIALASRVQKQLLPRRNRAPRGWRVDYRFEPAGAVSGDYCDILEADGDSLIFLLGDVSGKGVAASMVMSHLHATFRALAALDLPASAMVERANRLLCDLSLAPRYATLICGRAIASGEVELAGAGHLPALRFGRSGVFPIASQGLPIGLFHDAAYASSTIQLSPGEGLLLYSDGLTEARDAAGQEYGLARLSSWLERQHAAEVGPLLEACLSEIDRFTGARRTDDATVLAILRAPSP